MDRERTRVSIEVAWVRWAGRLRTLLRALAVFAVVLGGVELFFGPIVPTGTPIVGASILTGPVLIVAGLVSVLILSAL